MKSELAKLEAYLSQIDYQLADAVSRGALGEISAFDIQRQKLLEQREDLIWQLDEAFPMLERTVQIRFRGSDGSTVERAWIHNGASLKEVIDTRVDPKGFAISEKIAITQQILDEFRMARPKRNSPISQPRQGSPSYEAMVQAINGLEMRVLELTDRLIALERRLAPPRLPDPSTLPRRSIQLDD